MIWRCHARQNGHTAWRIRSASTSSNCCFPLLTIHVCDQLAFNVTRCAALVVRTTACILRPKADVCPGVELYPSTARGSCCATTLLSSCGTAQAAISPRALSTEAPLLAAPSSPWESSCTSGLPSPSCTRWDPTPHTISWLSAPACGPHTCRPQRCCLLVALIGTPILASPRHRPSPKTGWRIASDCVLRDCLLSAPHIGGPLLVAPRFDPRTNASQPVPATDPSVVL